MNLESLTKLNGEEKFFIILRIAVGAIFLWASFDKIADPNAFAKIIKNYQILPLGLVNIVAIFLPWLEAICGCLLIFGRLVKGSAFIINILMIIFSLALIINLLRGIDVNCGCFSTSLDAKSGDYLFYISRDMLILAASLWVFIFKIKTDLSAKQKIDALKRYV